VSPVENPPLSTAAAVVAPIALALAVLVVSAPGEKGSTATTVQ
jgi:hypothetical protein